MVVMHYLKRVFESLFVHSYEHTIGHNYSAYEGTVNWLIQGGIFGFYLFHPNYTAP